MKLLLTSNNHLVQLDDEDYDYFNQWSWCRRGDGYIGKGSLYLHREIMKRAGFEGEYDHKDRNKLNCQKENLRLATSSQNAANRDLRQDNSSGYKGVYWHRNSRKWRTQIRVKGTLIDLGLFIELEDAARAYDKAAKAYFKEFACLNFPGE